MSRIASRLAGIGPTVFSEFSALAKAHGAVNLGQGFPDFDGPDAVREAAVEALRGGKNQYPMGMGAPSLREALSSHSRRFYGLEIDPETMISVTSGATEAIFDTLLALVDPADEVILFEPYYDSYAASVQMAGGTPIYVVLRPPDERHSSFWFESAELEAAFSARTKLLVLNTPHNPTGKVFTRAELQLIADLCIKHGVWVLSDEVYEHLTFAPAAHIPISTLPGMFERTVTVGSAGKTFSFTGWKVGWAIAPPPLRSALQSVHQFVTFATAAPLQEAVAQALALPDSVYEEFIERYRERRTFFVQALQRAGMVPCMPEGTYFILASFAGSGFQDDVEFCRHLTAQVGVAAIPISPFYSPSHRNLAAKLVRFAFCKQMPTLHLAAERLLKARNPSGQERIMV